MTAEVSASFFDRLDAEAFERLEEALILADVGAPVTADVVGRLETEVSTGAVAQGDAARARVWSSSWPRWRSPTAPLAST